MRRIWTTLIAHLWAAWKFTPILLADQSGQIPSTLTDEFDALLTTTLRAMQPRLHDNITRKNKYIAYLRLKGRWRRQDGGERVKVALMHAQNSTADIYSGFGILDTTPQDGITSAFYEWSQMAVAITISRKEKRQNSGQSAAIGLLQSKTTQSRASITELLNNCVLGGRITASSNLGQFFARIGKLDSGATGPLPLSVLIDSNASRSVSVGNINGNTFSFWRNQAASSTASTFAGQKQEMNQIYNDCARGAGGNPDLLMGDQRSWEQYFNSLQNQERYIITDQRIIDVLGGAGEDMLKFRGATFIWDEVVPDTETTHEVVDNTGSLSAGSIFFINSESMEYIVDSQTDFIVTPFVTPVGQDATVAEILWMGAVGTNNRRKNGVLYGIARNITT